MGRKNKIKIQKNGSAFHSPSKSFAIEGMENLRELIGKVPAETSQKLQYLYTELEKKNLELTVAKDCIKQLQHDKHINSFARGDSDSSANHDESMQQSIHQNQESIMQLAEVHVALNDEWKTMEEKVTLLSGDRVTLEGELNVAHEEIHVLKDEVKFLEANMEKTNKSLKQGELASAQLEGRLKGIISNLEYDLKEANDKVNSLKSDAQEREFNFKTISSDLKSEEEAREKRESELNDYIKAKDQANANLERALQETSLIQRQIIQLSFAIGKDNNEKDFGLFETAEQWERHLREKGDTSFVNESVLLIKKEFDSVRNGLSRLREKNGDLERRWDVSEKELKQYRQQCAEYCTTIENLEKQNNEIKRSNEVCIAKAYQDFDRMKLKLEDQISSQELALKQHEESSTRLKKDLESIKVELDSGSLSDVLLAIKHLKEDCEAVRSKNTSDMESLSAIESECDAAKAQLSEKLTDIGNLKLQLQKMEADKLESEDKLMKLEEELTASKNTLKKVRKEKDSSTKKLKKRLDEVSAEIDAVVVQKKDLEEKLNEVSDTSKTDESFRSLLAEQSESYRVACEEIRGELSRMDKMRKEAEEDVEKLSEFNAVKEKEIKDLNSTIVAQKAKIDSFIEKSAENQKALLKAESRMQVLQRSSETMQTRYDEESAALRQKLESVESELEAQQDLNARLTTTTEEMRQKNTSEVAELNSEIVETKKHIEHLAEEFENMKRSHAKLVDELENNIAHAGSEVQELQEELVSCKKSLVDAVEKSEKLEEELSRVEELERKKTEVLVSLTEDEKIKIREEKENALLQLEAAQRALKDQKVEAKKHFDNDVRKLKKVIKTVEEQKNQALEEVSQVTQKLEETQQRQFDTKKFMEEEENKHRVFMEEFEKLQKSIQILRAEHEKKLADEVELSENFRNQIMQQDIIIERLSTNVKTAEDALVEMATAMELRDSEHEIALKAERKQLETLEKALEENLEQVEESVNRQMILEENERKTEQIRIEYETAMHEISNRLAQKQSELEKKEIEMTRQTSDLDATLEKLKTAVAEKDAIIDGINKKKSALESEKSELEDQVGNISKQLAESPRKIIQLENRLGVVQLAAQAQNKRLEEDLLKTNEALAVATNKTSEFEELLVKKTELVDELSALNQELLSELQTVKEGEELVDLLKTEVDTLRQQNQDVEEENKRERAGLVDELIATKNRLVEYEAVTAGQRVELDQMFIMEQELKDAHEKIQILSTRAPTVDDQEVDKYDKLFPTMDPALRHLIRVVAGNRNFAYGLIGFIVYAVLIHLYILL